MKNIFFYCFLVVIIQSCSSKSNLSDINNLISIQLEFEEANINESLKGTQLLYQLTDEINDRSKSDNKKKNLYLKEKIKDLNKLTLKLIRIIDRFKLNLIKKENQIKSKDLYWNYKSEPIPYKFNYKIISNLDKSSKFNSNEKIIEAIVFYRNTALESTGNYQWNNNNYILNLNKNSNKAIILNFNSIISDNSKMNTYEGDNYVFEVFVNHLNESNRKILSFNDSNILITLMFLTSVEHDVLEARYTLISFWYSKVRH